MCDSTATDVQVHTSWIFHVTALEKGILARTMGVNLARSVARAMWKGNGSRVLVCVDIARQRPMKTLDGGERRMEVLAGWGVERLVWVWSSVVSRLLWVGE